MDQAPISSLSDPWVSSYYIYYLFPFFSITSFFFPQFILPVFKTDIVLFPLLLLFSLLCPSLFLFCIFTITVSSVYATNNFSFDISQGYDKECCRKCITLSNVSICIQFFIFSSASFNVYQGVSYCNFYLIVPNLYLFEKQKRIKKHFVVILT